MMMEISAPNPAIHPLLAYRGGMTEPLDCSPPILDLCIRRRDRSPSPKREQLSHDMPYPETPSSTVGILVSSSSPSSETSEMSTSPDPYMQSALLTKMKIPRPFKAYPKDPLALAAGVTAAECVFGKDSTEAYSEFRRRMLAQVQATQGITNKNMRRTPSHANSSRDDPSYWEKRRKNNEAAKRSRDARRAKEDEIAIRAAFLEQENLKLRYELAALKDESEKLKSFIYNHHPLV